MDPQGRPGFSDQPCAAGTRQEMLQPRSNTLDIPGLRGQHLLHENQRMRQEPDNDHISRRQMPPDLQARRIDSMACQRAQKEMEIAADAIGANRHTVQASRRSAMHGACGLKAPPQVTIINNPASYPYRRP